MTTRRALLISSGMTLCAALFGALVIPSVPPIVPVHWGINGEVDGWAPKAFAVWGAVGFMALFTVLIPVLRVISPKPFLVDTFASTYNKIMTGVVALGAYMLGMMIAAALYPEFPSGRWLIAGLFVFFALMGNVLGKVRRNFWIGVRTPWTIADERVWDGTHRTAGRLWFFGGLLGAFMVAVGLPPAWAFGLMLVMVFWPLIQSFLMWKRLGGNAG